MSASVSRATIHIAVLPGDGIGPEVVAEGLKVLHALDRHGELGLTTHEFAWGTDWYRRQGDMMPGDALDQLSGFDAIYLGAVGSPLVPDHITLRGFVLRLRFGFDQYVNLRPIRLLPGAVSPLATRRPLDIMFVREGSEGEYAGVGDWLFPNTAHEVALQTAVFSRRGVERVIRWTFEEARMRGRHKVTSVSKANAMNYSGVLWDRVFNEIAVGYPDLESETLLVDAAAMLMITHPDRFDVVVTSNLYADILTEIGAALQGGIGLAASGNLNPERRFPSMFEPIHGSAPDIAGRGIANPIGAIWSAALMLEWLGLDSSAAKVLAAIEEVLGAGECLTPDLGGSSTTSAVGDAIAERVSE